MGTGRATSSDRALSARRVVALAVAIGCHLVLLMTLLRPASPSVAVTAEAVSDDAAIKLRFVSPPPTMPVPASPSVPQTVPRPHVDHVIMTKASSPAVPSPMTEAPPQPEAPATASAPSANDQPQTGDGGFRDRLINAQHAQDVHGVPGSDRTVAPGIVLTNPMDQGIGSVMRNAQRLFGVTNRHCIDVDVWQNLSPDELKKRHLTAEDVQKAAEKYQCNRPKGLNF